VTRGARRRGPPQHRGRTTVPAKRMPRYRSSHASRPDAQPGQSGSAWPRACLPRPAGPTSSIKAGPGFNSVAGTVAASVSAWPARQRCWPKWPGARRAVSYENFAGIIRHDAAPNRPAPTCPSFRTPAYSPRYRPKPWPRYDDRPGGGVPTPCPLRSTPVRSRFGRKDSKALAAGHQPQNQRSA